MEIKRFILNNNRMDYVTLIVFFTGGYYISEIINQKIFKKQNDEIINIFSFSLIFLFIYLLNSYSLILNFNSKYINYTIIFILTLGSLFFFKRKDNYKNILNIKNYNLLIVIIIIFYFILVAFQAPDEDSLRYHLPIAKKIINGSFYENTWFDYITIGSQEFINVFFLNINISNGASILNFIFLILYIKAAYYFKKLNNLGNTDYSNLLIVLSSPYLISLLTSQKLYFMPCLLVTLVFLYFHENFKKINNLKLHLMAIIISFCLVIKSIFIIYFIGFFFIIIWKKKKFFEIIKFYIIHFAIFIIIFLPIFYIKFKIYNDPFIPYLSINFENDEWFKEYRFWLTVWEMDITDKIKNLYLKVLVTPLKLTFPLSLSDIFKCLGIGTLFAITISYKNKYKLYLVLFFFLNVFFILNTQTRWFLPFLIIVSLLSVFNNNLVKKIIYTQSVLTISILIVLSLLTLTEKLGFKEKNFVRNLFIDSHNIIDDINKSYKNQKVFTALNTFYYFNNYVPIYYPKLVLKIDKNFYRKNYKKNDLILWLPKQGLSRIENIDEFVRKAFRCEKYDKIKTYKYNTRRFFILKSFNLITLYQLKC